MGPLQGVGGSKGHGAPSFQKPDLVLFATSNSQCFTKCTWDFWRKPF